MVCDAQGVHPVSINLGSQTVSTNKWPDGLSTLTSLTSLAFFNNMISATAPASWSALTNLRELSIRQNIIAGSLPDVSCTVSPLDERDLIGARGERRRRWSP